MSKSGQRLSADAFDYFEPRPLSDDQGRATDRFAHGGEAQAPIRVFLGDAGDTGFVNQVVESLLSIGLTEDEAESAATLVLLDPSIALVSGDRIYQSVVLAPSEDSDALAFPLRISVAGRLKVDGRSKSIEEVETGAEAYDLDSSGDRARLAVHLARVIVDYPAPVLGGAGTQHRFTCIILGRPLTLRQEDTSRKWNEILSALGKAFRVEVRISTDQSKIKNEFPASTRLTIALDPAFIGTAIKVGKVPTPVLVDCAGLSAEEMAMQIAEQLESAAIDLDSEFAATVQARPLLPGERAFHRKIGSSPAYDRFGEACKQCAHPIEKFKRYFAAPKAAKGMAKLYSNFDESMLYHCGRGYGCHVYAVFAPQNLQQ